MTVVKPVANPISIYKNLFIMYYVSEKCLFSVKWYAISNYKLSFLHDNMNNKKSWTFMYDRNVKFC